jgi:hypothetical protein
VAVKIFPENQTKDLCGSLSPLRREGGLVLIDLKPHK